MLAKKDISQFSYRVDTMQQIPYLLRLLLHQTLRGDRC